MEYELILLDLILSPRLKRYLMWHYMIFFSSLSLSALGHRFLISVNVPVNSDFEMNVKGMEFVAFNEQFYENLTEKALYYSLDYFLALKSCENCNHVIRGWWIQLFWLSSLLRTVSLLLWIYTKYININSIIGTHSSCGSRNIISMPHKL